MKVEERIKTEEKNDIEIVDDDIIINNESSGFIRERVSVSNKK